MPSWPLVEVSFPKTLADVIECHLLGTLRTFHLPFNEYRSDILVREFDEGTLDERNDGHVATVVWDRHLEV